MIELQLQKNTENISSLQKSQSRKTMQSYLDKTSLVEKTFSDEKFSNWISKRNECRTVTRAMKNKLVATIQSVMKRDCLQQGKTCEEMS